MAELLGGEYVTRLCGLIDVVFSIGPITDQTRCHACRIRLS
jgi:hypothetical protein